MFGTEKDETMPVEVVDTMIASIVLSLGGKVVVRKDVRDRVNREGLVYAFQVNEDGDGVLTVVTKAERDEQDRKANEDADAFMRELFRTLGMTDAEIDAALAEVKDL